jgi:transcriptional regulator with XRE-family HTH domain
MPRSPGLELSEEGIKLANDAFKLTGLSQEKLADRIADKYECIFTRQVIRRFLKGESVSNQNFVWLCQELGLDVDEVASLLCEPTAETQEQPTPVASPVQQSNVPSRPPHFLSREVELKAVKEKILAQTLHLVGVWGMSGIGKSVDLLQKSSLRYYGV